MNKVYTRINWENYPSENTALNESNLNKMDSALNEIDTRVVEHDTTKANVASLNELINYWHIDETTGVITIHKVSGEQIIFDLNLEKVPVGFSMTDDGILIMTTDDGTEFTANIGSMIPVLTFNDSEQIAVSVSGEGVNKSYTFTIKTGSIGEDKLQPNFLADCRLYAGNAENSALRAEEYAEKAEENAEKYQDITSVINQASKSWMMPTDIEIAHHGIGAPSISVESGAYYLDVVTGNVYLGGTEWTLDRTLTSVQDEIETINSNLEYKPGDTFKSMGQFAGQTNTNGVYFTIPLSKPVKSGASVSVSAGNYTVITPSGYIAISAKAIAVHKVSENCLFCLSNIGSQNNACCTVHGEFRITIS